MRYHSTRNSAADYTFKSVVSQGLAPEGGLFIPVEFPDVSAKLDSWSRLSYRELAVEVFSLYTGEDLTRGELEALIQKSLSTFRHENTTPLVSLDHRSVLELFHGPTYSFKDVALQTLGNLFEKWPGDKGRTILGATSGDTGSAAIHGIRGKENLRIFMLFPEGRVSPVQEKQMTSVMDDNVHCVSVDGSFDDCQNMVKELFMDLELKESKTLSAVNSINWSRILAQIVYYFYGYFRWLENRKQSMGAPLLCSVPTGNFGDIFAGHIAMRMGLPIHKLIIANNENDILTRFMQSGSYEPTSVVATTSPAMDIQVSSNFERLLFLACGEDSKQIVSWMEQLKKGKAFSVSDDLLGKLRDQFMACRIDQSECLETIKRVYEDQGYLLDPHSAVGFRAAEKLSDGMDFMSLSTAHPGKFAEAVNQALGENVALPDELQALENLPTRKKNISSDLDELRALL